VTDEDLAFDPEKCGMGPVEAVPGGDLLADTAVPAPPAPPPNCSGPIDPLPPRPPEPLQRLRVMSDDRVGEIDGVSYWPVRKVKWGPPTADWSNVTACDTGVVFSDEGDSFAVGQLVWGRQQPDPATFDGRPRVVFAQIKSGGTTGDTTNITIEGGGALYRVMGHLTVDPDSVGADGLQVYYLPCVLMKYDPVLGDYPGTGGGSTAYQNFRWLLFHNQDGIVTTGGHMPWPRVGEVIECVDTGMTKSLFYVADPFDPLPYFTDDLDDSGLLDGTATHEVVAFAHVKEEMIVQTVGYFIDDNPDSPNYLNPNGYIETPDGVIYLPGYDIVDPATNPPGVFLLPHYQPAITGPDTAEPLCVPGRPYDAEYTNGTFSAPVRVPLFDEFGNNLYVEDDPDTYVTTTLFFPLYVTRDFPAGVQGICFGDPPSTVLILGG
jgi:hypothetical protein